jgi:hypothetical protein
MLFSPIGQVDYGASDHYTHLPEKADGKTEADKFSY